MKIDKIVETISLYGNRKTDKLVVRAMLLYYGAIMMNRFSYRKDVKYMKPEIKIFAMIFAESGMSKSFTLGIIEKITGVDVLPDEFLKMYNFNCNHYNEKPDENIIKFLPQSATVSAEGTSAGLFDVAEAVSMSKHGSLNIFSDEFGEEITSSRDLLAKLKQLYDGDFKVKVIRGSTDEKRRSRDIKNLPTNFIGATSKEAMNKLGRAALASLMKSGQSRRSITIVSKQYPEVQHVSSSLDELIEYFNNINDINLDGYRDRLSRYNVTDDYSELFSVSNEFSERLSEIDEELVNRAALDRLNQFNQFDTGSLEMIVNIAIISSFLEGKKFATVSDLNGAYTYFLDTREGLDRTFDEPTAHEEIWSILKHKSNLTHAELIKYDSKDVVPKAKNQFADSILLVKEMAYRRGMRLTTSLGEVVRISIAELEKTSLRELIFSVSTDDKKEKCISFQSRLFDWNKDIENLVKSNNVDSFTCSHYEPSPKTEPHGHRRKESHIQGENVITFDIDDGMTVKEAEELFSDYTYCIYTTKSHLSSEKGFEDRFRIIFPVVTKFYVTPEQHKLLYKNIEDMLGFKNNDTSTRNVSRLFYTNPDADVYINTGKLLDVNACMPETEKNDEFIKRMSTADIRDFQIRTGNADMTEDEIIDMRLSRAFPIIVSEVSVGSLDSSINKLGMMVRDLTDCDWLAVERWLSKLSNTCGYPSKYNDAWLKRHV